VRIILPSHTDFWAVVPRPGALALQTELLKAGSYASMRDRGALLQFEDGAD